ncbi:MAG: helix-turn-helix domain-containing protein [Pseudomonadota bacterium]
MLNFPTDKKGVILKASFEVFITYGFRKTSMDDIARAAGMSRPALYQFFKNKTDIFRALSARFCEVSLAKAEVELNTNSDFKQRLTRAIEVSVIEMNAMVEATPHGMELMAVNDEIAHDLEEVWNSRFTALLTRAFSEAQERGEIQLSLVNVTAQEAAQLFDHTMEGLRTRCMRGEKVNDAIYTTVRFFVGALTAQKASETEEFSPAVAQIA